MESVDPTRSSTSPPRPRHTLRPSACTNCRRRKIKCDSARPICNQCTLRPPRTATACRYHDIPLGTRSEHESVEQMQQTIQALRDRIEELEVRRLRPAPTFHPQEAPSPYLPTQSAVHLDLPEPPSHKVAALIEMFFTKFADSAYFFLDALAFQQSALLPLPFGHHSRPSPALLITVYLWASVLSPSALDHPYTPATFLFCALDNIANDVGRMARNPQLVVETIQAEILLSVYYLHTASPLQGHHRVSAAAAIALEFGLHLVRSPRHEQLPPYSIRTLPLTPSRLFSPGQETVLRDAFWATVIINNHWAVLGVVPSIISPEISTDSAWTSSAQGGTTVATSSSLPHLVKASILLARVTSLLEGPQPGPPALAATGSHLNILQAALPLFEVGGGPTLLLTHALVDFTIVRLHSAEPSTSEHGHAQCLSAAARIVSRIGGVDLIRDAQNVDPMLAAICAEVATIYVDDIAGRSESDPLLAELEQQLGCLMVLLASLAPYGQFFEHCFLKTRTVYAGVSQNR
ncbi:hypothetical protein C8R46DRAFT_390021 [Mycena filopes]|nr:hypothetical protein C8R46DRAFT_390021 [Mycena filopes]